MNILLRQARFFRLSCLAAVVVMSSLDQTHAQTSSRDDLEQGVRLAKDSKLDDALHLFEQASLSNDPQVRDRAIMNRAHTLVEQGRDQDALAALDLLDRQTRDPELIARSRFERGMIQSRLASQLISTQPQQALEMLEHAEQSFRAAAAFDVADQDSHRKIELVQRLAAAIREQLQNQNQQQQQQQKNNQSEHDKDEKSQSEDSQNNQQEQSEDQGRNQQSQNAQSEQGQQGSPSESEQSAHKPEQEHNQQDSQAGRDLNREQGQQDQSKEDSAQQDQNKTDQSSTTSQPDQQTDRAQTNPRARPYDPKAAQILEKERRERAMMAELLRRLRGKNAPVEKDW